MESILRFVIVFLWCVCFGFFSVMGYLDDAMVTSPVLAGLLAALIVYCTIEWRPKIRGLPIRAGWIAHTRRDLYARISRGIRAFLPRCVRIWHKTRAFLTSINLPVWRSAKKRFLPASKPSVSSKSLP